MPNLPLMETIHVKHKNVCTFMLLSQMKCTLPLASVGHTSSSYVLLIYSLNAEIILACFHFYLVIVVMCLSFFRSTGHTIL